MKHAALRPAGDLLLQPSPRAGVLLPLPLSGAYDYKLPKGTNAVRGLLVSGAFGSARSSGRGLGRGGGRGRRQPAERGRAAGGAPSLPQKLCDFVDWVAQYTLSPPGMILAMVLRGGRAFAPEAMRTAYVRGRHNAKTHDAGAHPRARAIAEDGLARSVPSLAEEAGVTPAVVRGLIEAGALVATELPEFPPYPAPDPDFARPVLNAEQRAAADAITADVAGGRFAASLLDGVTGSGKTETYFEAIAEALRRGKQTLILLPEIALTVQFSTGSPNASAAGQRNGIRIFRRRSGRAPIAPR